MALLFNGLSQRLSPSKLRWTLALLFTVILIPLVILVVQTQRQIKWEAFYQFRSLATELAQRIDKDLQQAISKEEAYRYGDYQFLVVAGDLSAVNNSTRNLIQRSSLASFPVNSDIPGLKGYFQVDPNGVFSTPLLPAEQDPSNWGIGLEEIAKRRALKNELLEILSANQLISSSRTSLSFVSTPSKLNDRTSSVSLGQIAPLDSIRSGVTREPAEIHESQAFFDQESLAEEMPAPATNMESEPSLAAQGASPTRKPAFNNDRPASSPMAEGISNISYSPSQSLRQTSEPYSQDVFEGLEQKERSKDSRDEKKDIEQTRLADLKLSKEAFSKAQKVEKAKKRTKTKEETETKQEKLSKTKRIKKKKEKAYTSRKKRVSTEQRVVLPNIESVAEADALPLENTVGSEPKIEIFESELDPFELAQLDSGEYVLFRKVWREGQRYIQGAIIDAKPFIAGAFARYFKDATLSQMSDLVVAYQGNVSEVITGEESRYPSLSRISASELTGSLLHQTRLTAPMDKFELVWTINSLPSGPGAKVVIWAMTALVLILVAAFIFLYRLGIQQIHLNKQQQDFVSSISHELKTPLTSIRMYGEMLKQGWVTDEKKREYYDFIHDESERLSRLIANVLQLARMERNDLKLSLKPVRVSELMDMIYSKIHSQVEKAGFTFNSQVEEKVSQQEVFIDQDALSQVMINLVDNAIKFSAKSEQHQIDVTAKQSGDGRCLIVVRDYGPGIPKNQLRKIFKLFYRAGNELTRETVGTGIGLALVQQLVKAMNGNVDVFNQSPGVEFQILLPSDTH